MSAWYVYTLVLFGSIIISIKFFGFIMALQALEKANGHYDYFLLSSGLLLHFFICVVTFSPFLLATSRSHLLALLLGLLECPVQ